MPKLSVFKGFLCAQSPLTMVSRRHQQAFLPVQHILDALFDNLVLLRLPYDYSVSVSVSYIVRKTLVSDWGLRKKDVSARQNQLTNHDSAVGRSLDESRPNAGNNLLWFEPPLVIKQGKRHLVMFMSGARGVWGNIVKRQACT